MLGSVFTKTLRDQRRSVIGWLLGIVLLIAYVVAFWPSMERSPALTQITEELPEALRAFVGGADLTTARGFFSTQLFAFMLPVLVGILAVGKGAATVAGEEERGDLDLLLAQPVPRWRVALEKAAAVLATIAAVVAVSCAVLWTGIAVIGADVTAAEVARGMVGLGLLGWLLAAVALAVGAATGHRGTAVAAGAVVGLLAYLASTFARLANGLGWLAAASPWTWAFRGDALGEGPGASGVAGLVVLTAALLAAGIWRFTERDVGV
ncbi:MAG: ABC transporter permease subunit [Euzebyaceae bacterium]|jgi:ABC-2 type transport system permease protein|nr:ABC transporter permease subunit [Euzebyaceae bacterium]